MLFASFGFNLYQLRTLKMQGYNDSYLKIQKTMRKSVDMGHKYNEKGEKLRGICNPSS